MRNLLIVISFLISVLSVLFLLQPSFVIGTETPLRDMPMTPPSTPTAPPSTAKGQTQLPALPVPTETKDQQGNIRMTIKDGDMIIQDTIPKDATEEEKDRARGFITGYYATITRPDWAEKFVQQIISGNYTGDFSKSAQVGFLVGVEAALPARQLIRDTLDAIGVPKIPDAQPKSPDKIPIPPKTPTGPDVPL